MNQKIRKPTKALLVEEKLREDIISGGFSPGEKLQMDALKERYGVGYSPLREALSRLAAHGMVSVEEQCGFRVACLTLDELHDLYKIRLHIECLALEYAIQYGDDAWEANIIATWHRYAKYLDPKINKKPSPQQWNQLQKEFRTSLVQACQSPWLLKIRDLLHDQASRYRGLCINHYYDDKALLKTFLSENENLVKAVLARNTAKAIPLLKKSWKNSINVIVDILNKEK